jgi:hypothetical protein
VPVCEVPPSQKLKPRLGGKVEEKYRIENLIKSCYYLYLWFTGIEHRNSVEIFPLHVVLEENYMNFSIHSNLLLKILHFSYGPCE